jgi:hypothetical protein
MSFFIKVALSTGETIGKFVKARNEKKAVETVMNNLKKDGWVGTIVEIRVL